MTGNAESLVSLIQPEMKWDGRVDSVEHHGSRVVVAFSWSESSGTRHAWAQVLELRDDRIISNQDYGSRATAEFARRLRALVPA